MGTSNFTPLDQGSKGDTDKETRTFHESFHPTIDEWGIKWAMHVQGCLTQPLCSLQQAGSTEVFVENLPGYPDGISRASDGTFWVAIPAQTLPVVDRALPYK